MSDTEKNLTEQEWVDIARNLLYQDELNSASCHYFKASELNPKNDEANYFVAHLGFEGCLEEENPPAASRGYRAMAKGAAPAVAAIMQYKGNEIDDRAVAAAKVATTFITSTTYMSRELRTKDNIVEGVLASYALGDALKEHFGDDEKMIAFAVHAWKCGIDIQQQYYGYKYNDVKPETYAAKIQKVEPGYVMPKKPGCISFG